MLRFNFAVMTIFGIWCRTHWSPCRKIMYQIYLLVIAVTMFSLVSCQLARLLLVELSFVEFNDTFYFFLSISGSCFKLVANVINHKKISHLLLMFQEECCQVRNDFEENIKKRYDTFCRRLTLLLLIPVELTILLWLIGQTIGGIESHQLPYKVLQPYDLTNPLIYWMSYTHHMVAGFLFGAISLISDATINGFMLQLCAQLDILQYRVRCIPEKIQRVKLQTRAVLSERFQLKDCIEHHLHIYSIAEALESTFNSIISVQFFVSSLEICMTVYQLTARSAQVIDLLINLFFLICILGQISTSCFFGNELAVKSVKLSDAIYNIDWMPLSSSFKKCLILMILRSSKPIEISSGAVVNLTMVVKFAYSAFSFLKSTT